MSGTPRTLIPDQCKEDRSTILDGRGCRLSYRHARLPGPACRKSLNTPTGLLSLVGATAGPVLSWLKGPLFEPSVV